MRSVATAGAAAASAVEPEVLTHRCSAGKARDQVDGDGWLPSAEVRDDALEEHTAVAPSLASQLWVSPNTARAAR